MSKLIFAILTFSVLWEPSIRGSESYTFSIKSGKRMYRFTVSVKKSYIKDFDGYLIFTDKDNTKSLMGIGERFTAKIEAKSGGTFLVFDFVRKSILEWKDSCPVFETKEVNFRCLIKEIKEKKVFLDRPIGNKSDEMIIANGLTKEQAKRILKELSPRNKMKFDENIFIEIKLVK